MALSTGTKLGPYEVMDTVGAGGMGEVYRARDGRLGRYVAIKVLPASFNSDGQRLLRFEQEAHAAASSESSEHSCGLRCWPAGRRLTVHRQRTSLRRDFTGPTALWTAAAAQGDRVRPADRPGLGRCAQQGNCAP